MSLPLFSLGKAEHKFRVNLMMQEKLEKKNAPSSIIVSAAGGGVNRGAVSSAVASVIESTHLNDDKVSVTYIDNSQISN